MIPLKILFIMRRESKKREKLSFLCKWRRRAASPGAKTKGTAEHPSAALRHSERLFTKVSTGLGTQLEKSALGKKKTASSSEAKGKE